MARQLWALRAALPQNPCRRDELRAAHGWGKPLVVVRTAPEKLQDANVEELLSTAQVCGAGTTSNYRQNTGTRGQSNQVLHSVAVTVLPVSPVLPVLPQCCQLPHTYACIAGDGGRA